MFVTQHQSWTQGGRLDQWVGPPPPYADQVAVQRVLLLSDKSKGLYALEKLAQVYPTQAFILLRLAEVYYLLQDLDSALEVARRVRAIAKEEIDPVFDEWLVRLEQEDVEDKRVQMRIYERPELGRVIYATKLLPMDQYQRNEPVELRARVKSNWEQLRSSFSPAMVTELYARLLCIETNELEDVFRLGGSSMIRLLRAGFFTAAIEHVEPYSNIKDREKIVSILKDVQGAAYLLRDWVMSGRPFSIDLVLQVHARCVESNRVVTHTDQGRNLSYTVVIPVRKWRKKTIYAPHRDGAIIFHPFQEVPRSMEIFESMVRSHMGCPDVFTFSAWIHHTLISIHPFNDGNGRTTRLIASLPLVLADLPPISVSLQNKAVYFAALHEADTKNDIRPLASFFAAESLQAMEKVKEILNVRMEVDRYNFDEDYMKSRTVL